MRCLGCRQITMDTCCRKRSICVHTNARFMNEVLIACMLASVRICAWALASTASRPGQLLCGHAASQAGETNAGSLVGAEADPGPSQPASARQKHTQRGGTQSQRAPKRRKYFQGDDEETIAKENLVRPALQKQGIARTSALCIQAQTSLCDMVAGAWLLQRLLTEARRRPRSTMRTLTGRPTPPRLARPPCLIWSAP